MKGTVLYRLYASTSVLKIALTSIKPKAHRFAPTVRKYSSTTVAPTTYHKLYEGYCIAHNERTYSSIAVLSSNM